MAEATPGPWFVRNRKKNRICGPEGVIVGEAWFPPAKAKREAKQAAWEIGQANARLMAASPDLLTALETFVTEYVELVESGDAGFWNAEDEDKVKAARTAIAKARGIIPDTTASDALISAEQARGEG